MSQLVACAMERRRFPVGRGAGLLILLVHDRVDLGIDGLRTSNRHIEQFTGTDFALADQASERDRVESAIFFKSRDLLFHSRNEAARSQTHSCN
jgi:hypothetical protein